MSVSQFQKRGLLCETFGVVPASLTVRRRWWEAAKRIVIKPAVAARLTAIQAKRRGENEAGGQGCHSDGGVTCGKPRSPEGIRP